LQFGLDFICLHLLKVKFALFNAWAPAPLDHAHQIGAATPWLCADQSQTPLRSLAADSHPPAA